MPEHTWGYICQDKENGRQLVILTGRKINYWLPRKIDPTYKYLVEKFTEFMRRYKKDYTCPGLSCEPVNIFRPGGEK